MKGKNRNLVTTTCLETAWRQYPDQSWFDSMSCVLCPELARASVLGPESGVASSMSPNSFPIVCPSGQTKTEHSQ